jgi:uncharacterized membrane protein
MPIPPNLNKMFVTFIVLVLNDHLHFLEEEREVVEAVVRVVRHNGVGVPRPGNWHPDCKTSTRAWNHLM